MCLSHTLPALSPSTILSFLTHWWFLNQIISFDSLTSSSVVLNALCLSYCRLLLWESLNLFRKTKSWKITSSVKYNSQADYSCRHMILSVTILIVSIHLPNWLSLHLAPYTEIMHTATLLTNIWRTYHQERLPLPLQVQQPWQLQGQQRHRQLRSWMIKRKFIKRCVRWRFT